MTMPEILRRKLMERIDIASEPDDLSLIHI